MKNNVKLIVVEKDGNEKILNFGENGFFKAVSDLKGASSIPDEKIRIEFKDKLATYLDKIRYINYNLTLKDDDIKSIKVYNTEREEEILLFNSEDLDITFFGHFFDYLSDVEDPLNEGVKMSFSFV